jgi:ubiquinone/menaquinone biosynthesis C-methylase UbiE
MRQSRAFRGGDASAVRWFAEQPDWWDKHYFEAVDGVVDFFAGDGLSLDGRRVLDLGCGDGIISLGLASRTRAASVIGLDLQPVDTAFLTEQARRNGVDTQVGHLTFGTSDESGLPLPDGSVDVVITWSVFEHVSDLPKLLAEIHRVLVTDGLLFIQIWPLFYSEHGSHLWPWFGEGFAHLILGEEELAKELADRTGSEELARSMLDLYDTCNRLTLDELGTALTDAGFYIAKVETDQVAVHVPPELQRMPLSLITTAGIKLAAVKQGSG